jgi:hypothetical protein
LYWRAAVDYPVHCPPILQPPAAFVGTVLVGGGSPLDELDQTRIEVGNHREGAGQPPLAEAAMAHHADGGLSFHAVSNGAANTTASMGLGQWILQNRRAAHRFQERPALRRPITDCPGLHRRSVHLDLVDRAPTAPPATLEITRLPDTPAMPVRPLAVAAVEGRTRAAQVERDRAAAIVRRATRSMFHRLREPSDLHAGAFDCARMPTWHPMFRLRYG